MLKKILVIIWCTVLLGCKPNDPFATMSNDAAALAVYNAAVVAAISLKQQRYQDGSLYLRCQNAAATRVLCNKFYHAMQHQLRTSTKLGGVTVRDITNINLYKRIHKQYKQLVFYSLG